MRSMEELKFDLDVETERRLAYEMHLEGAKRLKEVEQDKVVTELQLEVHKLKAKVEALEFKLEPTGLDDSKEEADKGDIESKIESKRFSVYFKDKGEGVLFVNGYRVIEGINEDVFKIESAGVMTDISSYDEIKELLKGSVGIECVEELALYSNGSFKSTFIYFNPKEEL